MLAEATPARFVAFDVLAEDDRSLLELAQTERRKRLEAIVGDPVELIEQTNDVEHAASWLQTREGVIAKRLDAPYRPGERIGMVKIRRTRTLDCVVIGWRERESGDSVASLILGLYTPDGEIRHVGHTSRLHRQVRARAGARSVDAARDRASSASPGRAAGRAAAGTRRGARCGRELVCEVEIDHVSGGRIRHGARFQRWRDDKPPAECRSTSSTR